MGGGQSTPRCLSLDLVLPLLTVIVGGGVPEGMYYRLLPSCLSGGCLLEFGFSHLMSSRSVLVVSVRLHFLLKFEQYPTVLVGHSLLCSFIGRQILEWQFGGYRSHLEHFEQPHTCFGGIKFLSLGPPQIKNRSHHIEILGLVFKSPPDWFVLWSLFFALV